MDRREKLRKQKEERIAAQSNQRLLDNASTKIRTTMIGAIAQIEKHLDEAMDKDPELEDAFYKIREGILDLGNEQIRELRKEFQLYRIEFQGYTYELRIIK